MSKSQLPILLCGPILRRTLPERLVIWWISKIPLTGKCELFLSQSAKAIHIKPSLRQSDDNAPSFSIPVNKTNTRILKIGAHAHVHLVDLTFDSHLPDKSDQVTEWISQQLNCGC